MEVLYPSLTFFCDTTGSQIAFFRHDLQSVSQDFEPVEGYCERTYMWF